MTTQTLAAMSAGDKRKRPASPSEAGELRPVFCINLNVVTICELRVGCNRDPIGQFQGFATHV
jgi:hypothetical protein